MTDPSTTQIVRYFDPLAKFRPAPGLYEPATDLEAKKLIERLDHYVWETGKISGEFSHRPYVLTAVIGIDGDKYAIRLPGRRGTVLPWLQNKLDALEAAQK